MVRKVDQSSYPTNKEVISIAYVGNIVEVWEQFYKNNIYILKD